MNTKTIQQFNIILDRTKEDILAVQSGKKDTSLDAIQFGAIIELLSLVLTRIDETEKGIR